MHWGLIGASTIAAQHMIDAIRAQPDNEISCVLSSNAERGRAFAREHNIASSASSLEELLADASIGCVYISTTNELHYEQALAAIAAGKHVLCEKPLAMNVSDARAMVHAAAAAKLVFATNHHLRNAGSHQKIKQLIAAGSVGEVLSIRIFHAVMLPPNLHGWRINSAAAGGGVIADIVVHDADTVRFYLDEDPQEVVALEQSGSLGQGVEDSAMALWRMPSGIMVQSHESFTHPSAGSGIEVHGSKGSIFARGVMTQRPVGTIELHNSGGVTPQSFSAHNLYESSVRRFIAATRGEGEPAASGVDGVKSLAVALAVKQAAVSGERVQVDYGEL